MVLINHLFRILNSTKKMIIVGGKIIWQSS
jgi:hypothetical protein